MGQEFFTNLPSEIIIDILSRLPVRSIIFCKCVCKSWLNLLGTHHFVKLHLSRSSPCLAVHQVMDYSNFYEVFAIEDDPINLERHELHYKLVTKVEFPHLALLQGSANGLLFLWNLGSDCYICNPITREYIEIQCPEEFAISSSKTQVVTLGFGASKMTGQHKLVRISHVNMYENETFKFLGVSESECHVYTLGTGSWRSIAPGDPLNYLGLPSKAFLNGNFHWLARDLNFSWLISCFDFETELFSTFSCPRVQGGDVKLSVLGDCLCFCEYGLGDKVVVWVMKEYGVGKSWTKEFVIQQCADESAKMVYPIKVFRDGDVLMVSTGVALYCYSTKSKENRNIDMFEQHEHFDAVLHTPSFLSLQSFGLQVNLI